jgi:hypothetical protein
MTTYVEDFRGAITMNTAFKEDTFIGAGEWMRCKARGSVGPETYVAGYFEDHARPRTWQIVRYRVPPPKLFFRLSRGGQKQGQSPEEYRRRIWNIRRGFPRGIIAYEWTALIGRQECARYEARLTRQPQRTRYRTSRIAETRERSR